MAHDATVHGVHCCDDLLSREPGEEIGGGGRAQDDLGPEPLDHVQGGLFGADAAADATSSQTSERALDLELADAVRLAHRCVEVDDRDLASDPEAISPGSRVSGFDREVLAAHELDDLPALDVDRGDDHVVRPRLMRNLWCRITESLRMIATGVLTITSWSMITRPLSLSV